MSQINPSDLRPHRALLLGALLLLALPFVPRLALAHAPSETYLALFLTSTNLHGQWDVAIRDLQQALGPTSASVGADERQQAFALDTVARLVVRLDGVPAPLRATDYFPVRLNSGEYLRVQFTAGSLTGAPARIEIDARVVFGVDSNMHGLLRLEHGGRTDSVAFGPAQPAHQFTLGGRGGGWEQWSTFVVEGVWHIWKGSDHILFLIALLLPAVLKRVDTSHAAAGLSSGSRAISWEGVPAFRPAFVGVLKIVTAFTVAHSLTLSLAALEIVRLPSRLVESVIAASVVLAAANNLKPVVGKKSWVVAFGFGLVHGFGFASVLAELGLARASLAAALVGFNVGVELGQLAIVAVFLPVAFGLRRSIFYRAGILHFGSLVVVLIAMAWMLERLLGLNFMPF